MIDTTFTPQKQTFSIDENISMAKKIETTVYVNGSRGEYPVIIKEGKSNWIVSEITQRLKGDQVLLVSDETVAPLHAESLLKQLLPHIKSAYLHVIPVGESSKSLGEVERLYEKLLDFGFSRGDMLVAVGGGVVGDLTGFVASIMLRGIDYIQVPTTTLAAVDSSVGGKTAINTRHGKNLVGTFYPPNAVCIAIEHLLTQPVRMHCSGLAEVVKIAITRDDEFFSYLEYNIDDAVSFDPATLINIVQRAITLKRDVVVADEREQGLRKVLNFGHTLGHTIESGSCYQLLHGEAVALGMLAELAWYDHYLKINTNSVSLATELKEREDIYCCLIKLLRQLGLDVKWKQAKYDLAALNLDKKRVATILEIPMVTAIGSYSSIKTSVDSLSQFVQRSILR